MTIKRQTPCPLTLQKGNYIAIERQEKIWLQTTLSNVDERVSALHEKSN
jgi:hypothetical protein